MSVVIYLQTDDGTMIPVPKEAAALSAVVRRAVEVWAERYGTPPQPADLDDDDDDDIEDEDEDEEDYEEEEEDDSSFRRSRNHPGRMPCRTTTDDEDEDEYYVDNRYININNKSPQHNRRKKKRKSKRGMNSSRSSSNSSSTTTSATISSSGSTRRVVGGEEDITVATAAATDHSDDTDRTASVIDDDDEEEEDDENEYEYEHKGGNRSLTPSSCTSPESSPPPMRGGGGKMQKQRGKSKQGNTNTNTTSSSNNNINTNSNGNNNNNNSSSSKNCGNVVDRLENGRKTPERLTAPKNGAGDVLCNEEDSATPSTLDDEEEEEENEEENDEEEVEMDKVLSGKSSLTKRQSVISSETPPQPELCVPTAYAHPEKHPSPKTTTTTTTSSTSTSTIAETTTKTVKSNVQKNKENEIASHHNVGTGTESNRNGDAPSHVHRRDSTTIYLDSPEPGEEDDDDDNYVWSVRMPGDPDTAAIPTAAAVAAAAAAVITPSSLTNEELPSPSSYHQRTPCMIGDDDDGLLLGGNTISSCSDETTPQSKLIEKISPSSAGASTAGAAALELANAYRPQSSKCSDGSPNNGRQSKNVRGGYVEPDVVVGVGARGSSSISSSGSVAGLVHSNNNPTEEVTSPPQQYAHINIKEIVIVLQNCLPSPRTDGETARCMTSTQSMGPNHMNPISQLPLSPQGLTIQPSGSSTSQVDADMVLATVAEPGLTATTTTTMIAASTSSGVVVGDEKSDPLSITTTTAQLLSPPPPLPTSNAAQICVEYMCHFVTDGGQKERLQPSAIPEPLPAPLVSLLSVWEREFLYRDILGQADAEQALAMIIKSHNSNMSYMYPESFLHNSTICNALKVVIPDSSRVALLMDVRRAAERLQVPSLYNLCTAWCADFMLRAIYTSEDHFEAAELIRRCFNERNEWTRREMDCLKLENEWPVNEEC